MRAAQDAQVMPPMTSSIRSGAVSTLAEPGITTPSGSGSRDRVAGLVDRRADRRLVQGSGAGDRDRSGGQVDVDARDAVDAADLLGDRGHAVTARHAGDLVAGGDHSVLLRV